MPTTLTAIEQATGEIPQWISTGLPRAGRTDLRLSGRRLFRIDRQIDAENVLFISLWQRQKGGYALSWTAFLNGGLVPQAVALSSLSDVMDHLEDICASLCCDAIVSPDDVATSQSALLGFISSLQRQTRFQRSFAAMASEALSTWDGWLQDCRQLREKS